MWSEKKEKIKRKTLIGNLKNGGIKMPDFRSQVKSLKYGWCKRILNPDRSKWKIIPRFVINRSCPEMSLFNISNSDLTKSNIFDNIPTFYV